MTLSNGCPVKPCSTVKFCLFCIFQCEIFMLEMVCYVLQLANKMTENSNEHSFGWMLLY